MGGTVTVEVVSVLAQVGPPGELPMSPGNPLANLAGSAVSTFLTTLIVGGILVALAPDYTERKMETVRRDPVGSCLYGLAVIVGIVLVAVLLFLTLVGAIVALPLLVVAIVVWAVGAAIAFLAIAERLVGHDDGWLLPLLVAAGMNGGLALTGIGGLVALCIGAAGFGAVLRDRL